MLTNVEFGDTAAKIPPVIGGRDELDLAHGCPVLRYHDTVVKAP